MKSVAGRVLDHRPGQSNLNFFGQGAMKVYEGKDIRNVCIVGHGDCGKTTLAAAMLYTAGATNRLTSVDGGNSITDFDEEEISRKVSISTGVANAAWKGAKVNLLDTPNAVSYTHLTLPTILLV